MFGEYNNFLFIDEIKVICNYSLRRILISKDDKYTVNPLTHRQVFDYDVEIVPFEETEIVLEDVNDIYELCFKYRKSKNIKEKVVNIKPIIDLVDRKVYKGNVDTVFNGVYSEDDIQIIKNKINAIRHANDNSDDKGNSYSQF
jgi:hypothetical protein